MIERRSARFILIDPENWVQLFRVHELVVNDPFRTLFSRTVWFSGGGADQTAPFRRRSTGRPRRSAIPTRWFAAGRMVCAPTNQAP
jgi:hypothetical protein